MMLVKGKCTLWEHKCDAYIVTRWLQSQMGVCTSEVGITAAEMS
jgi:hypothetical protein